MSDSKDGPPHAKPPRLTELIVVGFVIVVMGLAGFAVGVSDGPDLAGVVGYLFGIVAVILGVVGIGLGLGSTQARKLVSRGLGMLPGSLSGRIRSSIKPEIVVQDGLKWYVTRDLRYGYALSHDKYEHNLHEYYFRLTPPSGVFLDVGAGAGKYSVIMASRGATVYAWEPNPYNLTVFRKNLELNGLSATIYEAALGAEEKQAKLRLGALASQVTEGEGVPVDVRTLDSYDIKKADLVKIDTEGQEYDVLRGAAKTISGCQPALIIELHVKMTPGTRDRCQSLLDSWSYVYKEIGRTDGGNAEYLLALPKSRSAEL